MVAVFWRYAGNQLLKSVSASVPFGPGDLDNELAVTTSCSEAIRRSRLAGLALDAPWNAWVSFELSPASVESAIQAYHHEINATLKPTNAEGTIRGK